MRRPLYSVIIAVGAFAACGTLLGVDDYRVTSMDAGTVDVRFYSATCDQCARDKCVEERRSCEGDAACAAWFRCAMACRPDDGPCLYDCAEPLPVGNDAVGRVEACVIRSCATDCLSCGTIFSILSPTCAECALTDNKEGGLCPLVDACLRDDPACSAYVACIAQKCARFGHSDPGCRLLCDSEAPDASKAFYKTVGIRYATYCQSQCPAGKDWDCIGSYYWPAKTGPTATISLRLPDDVPDGSSTSIRGCRTVDACATPLGDRTPDAKREVHFDVPQSTGEADYYYEIRKSNEPKWIFVPVQPIVGSTTIFLPAIAPWGTGLDQAVAARGDQRNPGTGTLVTWVATCGGSIPGLASPPKPSLKLTATPGSDPYYGWTPDITLSDFGIAAFVNVPPGVTTLQVELDGRNLFRQPLPVEPDTLTFATFNAPPAVL